MKVWVISLVVLIMCFEFAYFSVSWMHSEGTAQNDNDTDKLFRKEQYQSSLVLQRSEKKDSIKWGIFLST